MEASRPTRPLLPPLHSVPPLPPLLSLSLLLSLSFPLSRHFHNVGIVPKLYIEGRGARTAGYRTTGKIVGPECDATKTVDKEQELEDEDGSY